MAWDFLQKLKGGLSKNKESSLKHRPMAVKTLKSGAKRIDKKQGSEKTEALAGSETKIAVERPVSESASLYLSSPHISEKASYLAEGGSYVFKTSPGATKPAISRAVEDRYKVSVKNVKIINVPSKKRRRGQIMGTKPGYKKAVVSLSAGQTIETY